MPSAANRWLVINADVLIDYLGDQPQAVAFLEGSDQPLAIAVVTLAELSVGVKKGVERQRLEAFVSAFEVMPLEKGAATRSPPDTRFSVALASCL